MYWNLNKTNKALLTAGKVVVRREYTTKAKINDKT